MTSFIGSVHHIASTFGEGVVYAASEVKRGVLYVAETGGNCMYDVYDLTYEGFEKLSKAAIADLKLVSLLPSVGGLFKDCIATLEAQKDLYYASKFIGSLTDFIELDRETGETSFTWPDTIKLLYAVGNFLDTGKFLQKYKVYEFASLSTLATKVGSYQVSFLCNTSVENIPVVGNLCSSPKDFFIFIASGIENYRLGSKIAVAVSSAPAGARLQALWNQLTIDVLLKAASSTGKMVLIAFGRTQGKTVWFAVADFATQNASLLKFWIDRSRQRELRFKHPSTPEAA